MKKTVLITGASTGIGAACAALMADRGWRVLAGVRRPEDALATENVIPLRLDVTDADQIAAARQQVQTLTEGKLDALINNAGIAVGAPLELIPLPALREQFEINVVGLVAVTQAMLPSLRAAQGRIVNIGSIAGRSAAPVSGAYSASKFAVEALTDALRMELASFGVNVSVIEPGAIQTPIWDKSLRQAEERASKASPEMLRLYERLVEGVMQRVRQSMKNAAPASSVAEAVWHAITANQPKTRYVVGRDARLRLVLNRLPDRWQDRIILKALRPK